jgi:putative FmdB family regulatory protein
MPTYDYECQECKHRFEIFQSMKDDPIKKCIKCGGKVKKLIGAGAGIIFKGSGFYVNDYKKSSSTSDISKPKSTKPSTSAETKSETAASTSSE